MVDALTLACSDATGRDGSSSPLLERIDQITAIPSFVWHVPDPARAVTDGLGVVPRSTRLGFAGGTVPQSALFDASRRIAAGELDVAVIVGAEAMKTRDLARRAEVALSWAVQDDRVDAARVEFAVPAAITDHERDAGLVIPVHSYALIEHARRARLGLSRTEHLGALGGLAARMSAVAATNDRAWLRDGVEPRTATTPSPTNRMISSPYTKLLTSNVMVDMGAACIVTSLEAARAAGVPDEQLVFPCRGASAREQWLLSERADLSVSLAMRACTRSLFGEHGEGAHALEFFDLYSCFPCAVELAADALGIDPLADARAPSVTGGMTFFGGPGNNYVTHSIATMSESLRASPGATGLVTGLGWYASTHSWGTYSTAPPVGGFRYDDVQEEVDTAPLRAADDEYEGPAVVESYTVVHDRDGRPTRTIASMRTPADARRIVASVDPDTASAFMDVDPLGAPAVVSGTSITLS
jgi:acetyl-CoA C-acetyltransferase